MAIARWKLLLGAAALGGAAWLIIRPGTARAAPGAPENVKLVESTLTLLAVAADAQSGKSLVFVVYDEPHKAVVMEILGAQARANPEIPFYVAQREFVLDAIPDSVELPFDPAANWGGTGAAVGGQLAVDRMWTDDTNRDQVAADIQVAIASVLGSIQGAAEEPPLGYTEIALEASR